MMRTQILDPHDTEAPGTAFRLVLDRLYRQGRQWRFRHAPSTLPRWQEETRARLIELLGDLSGESGPLELRRETVEETPEYRRERLLYTVLPGVTVPATLLLPRHRTGPAPAILCPPGHGNGMSQVIDEADNAYKGYPISLARAGFVCLVPEHLGFGERQDPGRQSGHDYYDHALNLLGLSSLGVMRHDLGRALDVLAALPEVDATRIGCWGLSLGGELTLLLAATDLRVRVAAISGFLSSYASSFLAMPRCPCGYAPGLARYLEHADIAALIAPRPLWVEIGDGDSLFPYQATEAAIQELSVTYAIAGDEGTALTYHLFPGEHEVSGEPVVDWFMRTL
jgi:dienelactone hydrolase